MDKLERFKNLEYRIPEKCTAWRIYGKGMENFGDNRKPTHLPVPEPGPDELLVRSDAVGLCFSDVKIINLGGDHPRLKGRDLKKQPVIPGHEVSLTVVKVGRERQDMYKPGMRFIIQADVYYKGKRPSYGYILPGGLSQYGIIGKEVLEGDEGNYLIPLRNENLGYSELALVEPWGCVLAAYRIKHRDGIKKDGRLLLVGSGKDEKPWEFSNLFSKNIPSLVVAANLGYDTMRSLTEVLSGTKAELIKESGTDIHGFVEKFTGGAGFDDIILLGDLSDDTVTAAADSLCLHGIMNYMITTVKPQTINIDAGKIHYDVISFVGNTGIDVSKPYTENLDYTIKGHSLVLFGAGGPMGQMHVQLAMEGKNPPGTIVATDISDERVDVLQKNFAKLAEDKGIDFYVLNPNNFNCAEDYRKEILNINKNQLYDYVVCLAAIPSVIEDSASYLGTGSVLNIFAGVSKGTIVRLNIKDVAVKKVRFIGSSGSSIDDMEFTLRKLERGELDTNSSVAGISGMNDVWKGVDAVRTGGFPGKIVVYPHIKNLNLMSLKELKESYPDIGAHLSRTGKWTREAEAALLDRFLDI
ncbi:MAG: zinc-binding dehydrogenase [Spirochaetota bacterium]